MADLDLGEEPDVMERLTHEWFEKEFDDTYFVQSPYKNLDPGPHRLIAEAEAAPLLEDCFLGIAGDSRGPVTTSGLHHFSPCIQPHTQFEPVPKQSMSFQKVYCEVGRDLYPSELRNVEMNGDIVAPVVNAKRKRTPDKREKADSMYRGILDLELQKLNLVAENNREKLARFLEYPMVSELGNKISISLRFLYLAIGSWQTIDDFKNQLLQAKNVPDIYKSPNISEWNAAKTYNEICRLDKKESLIVLLRRYHTLDLCKEEHKRLSHMSVETPDTIDVNRRSDPGNPIWSRDATLTDQLLQSIMPGTLPGSDEFKRARPRVKKLRKLAKYLNVLVESYGLGILALLPSGPSFGELSLTDSM
jgi:hypothetical protein